MEWNAEKYSETCGRVTEHGVKLIEILKDIECNRVLDLGCGTGILTNEISKFVHEVIGVDLSSNMIEKAKETFPNLKFTVMDACALPWENFFDIVFSNAVFHFIQSQDILLKNIHKVLTKNGMLVCEFGASGNIDNLLYAIAQACQKRRKIYSLRFFYPTVEEYKDLLEKNMFSIDLIKTYNLDTQLKGGELGLRNWINQIFDVEMKWFNNIEREDVLNEIESDLRLTQWDGLNWHLNNRRIKVIAKKRQI